RAAGPIAGRAVAGVIAVDVVLTNVRVRRAHETADYGTDYGAIHGLWYRVMSFLGEGKVNRIVECLLLDVRQRGRERTPAPPVRVTGTARGRVGIAILGRRHREEVIGRMVVVHCQPDLFQVVGALHAACRFTRRLHGGQQQGDQD